MNIKPHVGAREHKDFFGVAHLWDAIFFPFFFSSSGINFFSDDLNFTARTFPLRRTSLKHILDFLTSLSLFSTKIMKNRNTEYI